MESQENAIYTIHVSSKLEPDQYGFPNLGSRRTVGFYYALEEARTAIVENSCDMCENTYIYAILESVLPGMYGVTGGKECFKFNEETKKYEPLEEPEFLKHFAGFSMS